jgi:hypothetical protein
MGHGFIPFCSMPSGRRTRLEPGLTPRSSWIIHLYTNELVNAIGDLLQGPSPGSSGMSNFNLESVLSVHHWTDTLFSFTTTRDSSFRFRNGEFT